MLDKTDTRCRNLNWTVRSGQGGGMSFAGAQLAVLMDIRDELQMIPPLTVHRAGNAALSGSDQAQHDEAQRKRKAIDRDLQLLS
jgi:hypothetical protein